MKHTIRTDADAERLHRYVLAQEKPLTVSVVAYRASRSIEQNNLYWKWLTTIKGHIHESIGEAYTEDDLHDYYRELFLPVTHKTINGVEIKRLTSTTKLCVADMSEYLLKIDERCITRLKLMLPTREDL
jgi:hypothetical protein